MEKHENKMRRRVVGKDGVSVHNIEVKITAVDESIKSLMDVVIDAGSTAKLAEQRLEYFMNELDEAEKEKNALIVSMENMRTTLELQRAGDRNGGWGISINTAISETFTEPKNKMNKSLEATKSHIEILELKNNVTTLSEKFKKEGEVYLMLLRLSEQVAGVLKSNEKENTLMTTKLRKMQTTPKVKNISRHGRSLARGFTAPEILENQTTSTPPEFKMKIDQAAQAAIESKTNTFRESSARNFTKKNSPVHKEVKLSIKGPRLEHQSDPVNMSKVDEESENYGKGLTNCSTSTDVILPKKINENNHYNDCEAICENCLQLSKIDPSSEQSCEIKPMHNSKGAQIENISENEKIQTNENMKKTSLPSAIEVLGTENNKNEQSNKTLEEHVLSVSSDHSILGCPSNTNEDNVDSSITHHNLQEVEYSKKIENESTTADTSVNLIQACNRMEIFKNENANDAMQQSLLESLEISISRNFNENSSNVSDICHNETSLQNIEIKIPESTHSSFLSKTPELENENENISQPRENLPETFKTDKIDETGQSLLEAKAKKNNAQKMEDWNSSTSLINERDDNGTENQGTAHNLFNSNILDSSDRSNLENHKERHTFVENSNKKNIVQQMIELSSSMNLTSGSDIKVGEKVKVSADRTECNKNNQIEKKPIIDQNTTWSLTGSFQSKKQETLNDVSNFKNYTKKHVGSLKKKIYVQQMTERNRSTSLISGRDTNREGMRVAGNRADHNRNSKIEKKPMIEQNATLSLIQYLEAEQQETLNNLSNSNTLGSLDGSNLENHKERHVFEGNSKIHKTCNIEKEPKIESNVNLGVIQSFKSEKQETPRNLSNSNICDSQDISNSENNDEALANKKNFSKEQKAHCIRKEQLLEVLSDTTGAHLILQATHSINKNKPGNSSLNLSTTKQIKTDVINTSCPSNNYQEMVKPTGTFSETESKKVIPTVKTKEENNNVCSKSILIEQMPQNQSSLIMTSTDEKENNSVITNKISQNGPLENMIKYIKTEAESALGKFEAMQAEEAYIAGVANGEGISFNTEYIVFGNDNDFEVSENYTVTPYNEPYVLIDDSRADTEVTYANCDGPQVLNILTHSNLISEFNRDKAAQNCTADIELTYNNGNNPADLDVSSDYSSASAVDAAKAMRNGKTTYSSRNIDTFYSSGWLGEAEKCFDYIDGVNCRFIACN